MRTVYKYELSQLGPTTLLLPEDSVPLHVGVQGDTICIWIEQFVLKDAHPQAEHTFEVIGTGHALSASPHVSYIGTVHMPPFVWHIYECWA